MSKQIYSNINKLIKLKDSEINYSDISATDEDFWSDADIVLPSKKIHISLRLDEDIVAWFKQFGRGYQTRINSVLRSYVKNTNKKKKSKLRIKT
ncbi:hypothetical protein BMS3Abin04_00305 [bacterium BMS3Abin04]|nr:hypothetical protein BMS3Abin04_00305 [bacterium BMS3Abin04]